MGMVKKYMYFNRRTSKISKFVSCNRLRDKKYKKKQFIVQKYTDLYKPIAIKKTKKYKKVIKKSRRFLAFYLKIINNTKFSKIVRNKMDVRLKNFNQKVFKLNTIMVLNNNVSNHFKNFIDFIR